MRARYHRKERPDHPPHDVQLIVEPCVVSVIGRVQTMSNQWPGVVFPEPLAEGVLVVSIVRSGTEYVARRMRVTCGRTAESWRQFPVGCTSRRVFVNVSAKTVGFHRLNRSDPIASDSGRMGSPAHFPNASLASYQCHRRVLIRRPRHFPNCLSVRSWGWRQVDEIARGVRIV